MRVVLSEDSLSKVVLKIREDSINFGELVEIDLFFEEGFSLFFSELVELAFTDLLSKLVPFLL